MWQEAVVTTRLSPIQTWVKVGNKNYLLEHDGAIENHLPAGQSILVKVEAGRAIAWTPAPQK